MNAGIGALSPDEDNPELVEDPDDASVSVTLDVVDRAISSLIEKDKKAKWEAGVEIDLGTKQWRPSAVHVTDKARRVLYVAMNAEIPRHVRDRLALAYEQGYQIFIALTVPGLYDDAMLHILSASDVEIYVLDDDIKKRRYKRRHFLAAMADIEVPVSPEMRRSLGQAALAVLASGSSNQKGRRLEGLLAFLFSQVQDLRVVKRNYITATEEIDIVLQIDNFSGRVWQRFGPFILVECKNMAEKTDQKIMSGFIVKLQTTRRSARIGILISPEGFTEGARLQEMRFSTDDICVSMVDAEKLRALVEAADMDSELESLVTASLLR